jgi:hypothetical protein
VDKMTELNQTGFYFWAAMKYNLDFSEADAILEAHGVTLGNDTKNIQDAMNIIRDEADFTPAGPVYDWGKINKMITEQKGE